ncbi:MAG: hemolysin III family protein [Flavobacteriaceae bacterium]|nr:hemolysin III family protein [Flavobacteriaceae bacterium]
MKIKYKPTYYSQTEEKINIITHALGMLLSIIALVFLILKASLYGNIWHIVSFSVFGSSLIILYTASTLYHQSKTLKIRTKLNIFDHASIYILIAGTYTPFTLVTLNGKTGWWVFGITWLFAFIGVILKLFFTGSYDKLSTLMYVLMGWIILFAIKPLINNLPIEGIWWLFAGGISYTLGAILYSFDNIKFNHATFHVFVLIGSFCHFISVYFYVLEV